MTTMSVAQALAGHAPEGGQVTVKGWVRTRRDSKAGLSFVTHQLKMMMSAVQG